MEYFEFKQSYEKRTNVMTRCKIPEFCEGCQKDIEIYDPKNKRILARSVKQRDVCVYIPKNQYCVIWNKNRKDALLNGIKQKERNFKYVEFKIN